MSKTSKSLTMSKGKDTFNRTKPLIVEVDYMGRRKSYQNGGKVSK